VASGAELVNIINQIIHHHHHHHGQKLEQSMANKTNGLLTVIEVDHQGVHVTLALRPHDGNGTSSSSSLPSAVPPRLSPMTTRAAALRTAWGGVLLNLNDMNEEEGRVRWVFILGE
jgi:hypothetical protein